MTTKGPYAEMSAAGTTQATAAELVADKVTVTTVSAALAGVILPAGNRDDKVTIVNGQGTHTLFIYPRTGGKINNATANLPVELPPNKAAHFEGVNSLNWTAFF